MVAGSVGSNPTAGRLPFGDLLYFVLLVLGSWLVQLASTLIYKQCGFESYTTSFSMRGIF